MKERVEKLPTKKLMFLLPILITKYNNEMQHNTTFPHLVLVLPNNNTEIYRYDAQSVLPVLRAQTRLHS